MYLIDTEGLKLWLDNKSKCVVSVHNDLRCVDKDMLETRVIFYEADEDGSPKSPQQGLFFKLEKRCDLYNEFLRET